MARSVQSIKEAMEKKRQEIERLEQAEVEAQEAYEKKMLARRDDNQAIMIGRAILAAQSEGDIKSLLKRLQDAWTSEERAEFVKSGQELEADAVAAAEERAAERWAKMTPEQQAEAEKRKADREAERIAKKEAAKEARKAAKKSPGGPQAA